jgi:hypothetical protein
MELINATRMSAGYAQATRPDGRDLLVVVVKGTFTIPDVGESPALADPQLPLAEADIFTGEPGFSAPLYESDFAPFKPRCDVMLNGSAYATQDRPVRKVGVGIRVGKVTKAFDVVGDRVWEGGLSGIRPGASKPFRQQRISYDFAFGGTDRSSDDERKHNAYIPNPFGTGYRARETAAAIVGTPVPTTEETTNPIRSPFGSYRPMSFGPIARGWPLRAKHAGTYDQAWLDEVFPFLPHDFDDRYFQCAPGDQQTDYLRGGEEVRLINLTPREVTSFCLPTVQLPVVFFRQDGGEEHRTPVADTLYVEPDDRRFIMVWRTHLVLRRNMFEVVRVTAGRMSSGWWRARKRGKPYYRSLAEAARGRADTELGSPL